MRKQYMKLFLFALMFAATGVAWIHMQSMALDPSNAQAIYQLAQNRMLVDGLQTLFCTFLIWWVTDRAAKAHVPLRTTALFGLLFKGCLWFLYALSVLIMMIGLIASVMGFSSEQLTQGDLVRWNEEHRQLIVFAGSLVWGGLLLWSCFAFSVMAVRAQISSLQPVKKTSALNAPKFWQILAGFDPVFLPGQSPKLWLFFGALVLLKVLTWYLSASAVASLIFFGNLISMLLPVGFIVLLEQCLLVLSEERFSRLRRETSIEVAT